MKHIHTSRIIDRNAPELVNLFDRLHETLLEQHGIAKARYLHLAPSAGGWNLKVWATPPLRPLACDFIENRRHELLYDLADRLRPVGPTRLGQSASSRDARVPDRLRAARWHYQAKVNELLGEGWWHGFDLPTFGPRGRRGFFLLNPPLEQPLTDRYMAAVRRDLQDFHVTFCAADLATEGTPPLVPDDQELLSGLAAGMRMQAVATRMGLSERGAEDRLKRVRDKLDSKTTIQAVAMAVEVGLIP